MKKNNLNGVRQAERGGAGVKLLIVLVVLAIIGNAAYNYIPTAYQGESFKQEMETAVVQATAMPSASGGAPEALKARLTKIAVDSKLPPAVIEARQVNNVLSAHVKYSKDVSILPFGIYKYRYEFDQTATPTGFLLKDN